MTSVRQSVIIASGGRYICFFVFFLTTAILARLLTPHELGLSVIGTSVLVMGEALREFGTQTYLIQQERITREDTRTVFLVMLVFATVFAGSLAIFAAPIANFYGHDELVPYLRLIAISIVIGPFFWPVMTLLRREMAFVQLEAINIVSAVVGSVSTILLALLGFSFMSFAWAGILGTCAAGVMTLYLRPYFWMYMPSVSKWQEIFRFGRYSSVSTLSDRLYDVGQYWTLGTILNAEAIGFFSRAVTMAAYADRLLFAGLGPVALPALAARRDTGDLKQMYLRALAYTTVLQWPALLLIAFLAYPLVRIVLGDQWSSIVPLVQIVAIARMLSFPLMLSIPLLVAVGQIRRVMLVNLMALPINLAIFSGAAAFGLHAVAYSLFATISLPSLVAVYFVRLSIPFDWSEFADAAKKSALVTAVSATGLAAVALVMKFELDMSLTASMGVGLLASIGWILGVWIFQHPILSELSRLAREARRRFLGQA